MNQNQPNLASIEVGGTLFKYYPICHRKVWWFAHRIEMEHNSDAVYMGQLIHNTSYEREEKDLDIEGKIRIDFIDRRRVLHEVKKSNRMADADTWQVRYYLWFLKQRGINDLQGLINYPKLKKTVDVSLTPEHETEIELILQDIQRIVHQEHPPIVDRMAICRSCSYEELCWS